MSGIDPFLDKKLRDLVKDSDRNISDEDAERHRIYAGALAKIMRHYWCGNKYGLDVSYPMNPSCEKWHEVCPNLGNEYRGHNIAALAVDHDGNILDFEFNHNALFDSSAEHAEARLIRRLFSLSQVNDSWNIQSEDNPATKYSTALDRVTVYTSLESCTQCTGVMMLGRVKEVVYLQPDPGMYRIGDLLHTLTVRKLPDPKTGKTPREDFIRAPEPVSATKVGLSIAKEMESAFEAFLGAHKAEKPFSIKNGKPKPSESITSFLCTEQALEPFAKLAAAFEAMKLDHDDYKPDFEDDERDDKDDRLTNAKALDEAQRFVEYATKKGHRATPHR